MLVLSNALAERVDEGCVKVANSLIKRLKASFPNTYIITYERSSQIADIHLKLNKLLLNFTLFKILKKKKERLLYFPFPSRAIATSLRLLVLSLFSCGGVEVVLTQQSRMDLISRFLVKISGVKFIVFSRDSFKYYSDFLSEKRVLYLKTGVDTEKFRPVSQEKKRQLRLKYNVDLDKPVVLHVGHLKHGRNIAELMKLSTDYQIILIVSTLTHHEQDKDLRKRLEEHSNIRVIDDYLEDIYELYQLSDIYFFPVVTYGNCIDVPLSCLEAASCNKSVVTTRYGEMKEFEGKRGFFYIDSFGCDDLNVIVSDALNLCDVNTRDAVIDYDWREAVMKLCS